MSQALLDAVCTLDRVDNVDAAGLEAYLASARDRLTVLFFTGDPEKKLETADVAVVLRELLQAYDPVLRAGMIDRADETVLKQRAKVTLLPSLSFFHGPDHLETLSKIQDWSVYAERLPRLLERAGLAATV